MQFGNHEALISINELKIIKGGLPPRAYGLVVSGYATSNELQANWHSALHKPLNKIKPLE